MSRFKQQEQMTERGLLAAVLCACLLGLFMLVVAGVAGAATPPAGSRIQATAYAEFQYAAGPRSISESNVVVATVAGVAAFTLNGNQSSSGLPGASKDFFHVLTNTGNVPAAFDLTLSGETVDYVPEAVRLYADADCDGRPDQVTPWLSGSSGASPDWAAGHVTTPVLPAGGSLCFVVSMRIPPTANATQAARLHVFARSNPADALQGDYLPATPAANVDTLTAIQGPDLELTKSLSLTGGLSPQNDIEVVLHYRNRGQGEARDVMLVDILGYNSSQQPYSLIDSGFGSSADYDTRGFSYVPGSARWSGKGSAALTDADDGNEGGIRFRFDTSTGRVQAVIATVAAGQSGELRFRINAAANLPVNSAEQTTNRAVARFSDGVAPRHIQSNAVPYVVTGSAIVTTPRLEIGLTGPGVLFADTRGTYVASVRNTGPLATIGTTTVSYLLPPGVRFDGQAAGLGYWACAGDGQWASPAGERVTCVSNRPIPANVGNTPGSAPDIGFYVVPMFPQYPTLPLTQTHRACVSDGGDPTALPGVRCATVDTEIREPLANAALSGRIWLDADQNRQFNSGSDQPLASWRARLCPYDPAEEEGKPSSVVNDPVLGWVQTITGSKPAIHDCPAGSLEEASGPDGSFRFGDLPHGRYKVQFLDPAGHLIVGTAANGSAVAGNRSFLHWSHRFLVVDIQPGENLLEQNLPLDPSGVVYDVTSRAPLAGARVRLLGPAGFDPARHLLGGGSAVEQVTTVTGSAADGLYQFLLIGDYPAGQYRLQVTPPASYLPVPNPTFPAEPGSLRPPAAPCVMAGGRCSVDQQRSLGAPPASRAPFYFLSFDLGVGGDRTDVINNHIPVVPSAAQSGLFTSKTADRSTAELGDFVNYTVEVKNSATVAQVGLRLVDTLPRGFGYVKGTARVNGIKAEPALNPDGSLTFVLANLPAGQSVKLTYRVSVGADAMLGNGVNRAQAVSSLTQSNVAMAQVKLTAGVFSDKAYLLGKVFMDCNGDGQKQPGEQGLPGVRLFLDDGTFVITDVYGDYSLYGLSPRLHVVKVDLTTLPAGVGLNAFSNRHAGRGDSQFADLKKGELHRADFAVTGCSKAVMDMVYQRVEAAIDPMADAQQLLSQRLETRATVSGSSDARSLPASGLMGASGAVSATDTTGLDTSKSTVSNPGDISTEATTETLPAAGKNEAGQPEQFTPTTLPALNEANSNLPVPSPLGLQVQHAHSPVALEDLMPNIPSNQLGFLEPLDKQVLPAPQAMVRVKGMLGMELQLLRNGEQVSRLLVGKKARLPDAKLEAWEYVGVNLEPGVNTLEVRAVDPFGNVRGTERITVTAPGTLARISVQAEGPAEAGGRPVDIRVRLTDAAGVPVAARTPITLEAKAGVWLVPDLDPRTPGVQVFLEGGEGVFPLKSTLGPQDDIIRVTTGTLEASTTVKYLPVLRPLVASGLVHGTLAFRNLDPNGIRGLDQRDSFEQEIDNMSTCNSDYNCVGVRTSLFLKGKIKGDYLLTLAFDSDKNTRDREFRDIQPDEFYPVYGDSSIKGFDAQSTQRLYVRLDKGANYALLGDINTASNNEGRKLSQYSRSLTGLQLHHETGRASVGGFVTYDNLKQVIEELPANGTSGPYRLANKGRLINSEKVEIVVRDRNHPDLIIETRPQSRFSDYEIERDTGRIYFKAPVASYDTNFNPQSIRVNYEVEQDGEKFMVGGVEGQIKVTDKVEVGGVIIRDQNPADEFRMEGVNTTVKLAERTFVVAEYAQTSKDSVGDGHGERVEVTHQSDKLEARAYYTRTDLGFDNPSAILNQGRSEAGVKGAYRLPQNMNLQVEMLHTEDERSGAYRDGQMVNLSRRFNDFVTGEVGLRNSRDVIRNGSSANSANPSPGGGLNDSSDILSARTKLTTLIPEFPNTSAFVEYEQDVDNPSARNAAVGGEWRFADRGRAYVKHNLLSSINTPWALNQTTPNHRTLAGVEGDYMEGGQAYSEYRVDSGMDERSAEAALGLRNTFAVAEGLKLGTTFENTHRLEGKGDTSTAATAALEYTASPDWKGSTRYEFRTSDTQIATLFQLGAARRLDEEWTALGRYSIQRTGSNNGGASTLERSQRFQVGAAYRDRSTNRLSALGKYELRQEDEYAASNATLRRDVDIVSLHANYQPDLPVVLSGRFAGKLVDEYSDGIGSHHGAVLLSGRVTKDIDKSWDVGLIGSSLISGERPFVKAYSRHQWGMGAEVGYQVQEDFWLSIGYNFMGFSDRDFREMEYTDRGVFIRMKMKFDERAFGWLAPDVGDKAARSKD